MINFVIVLYWFFSRNKRLTSWASKANSIFAFLSFSFDTVSIFIILHWFDVFSLLTHRMELMWNRLIRFSMFFLFIFDYYYNSKSLYYPFSCGANPWKDIIAIIICIIILFIYFYYLSFSYFPSPYHSNLFKIAINSFLTIWR